jgi:hypothetical protein
LKSKEKEARLCQILKTIILLDLYIMITHRHIQNWYVHGMKWKLADTINNFFDFFWKVVAPLSVKGIAADNIDL